jgi:hypothetical protein
MNLKKCFGAGTAVMLLIPMDFLWEIVFNPFMELDEKGNVKPN